MIPTFAVVGRVNEGKSSVVAALTENDRVAIGPAPGTTEKTELHELVCGGRTVCRVYDTPGFQQPEALYEWVRSQGDQAQARRSALERFVRDPLILPELTDERELLTPLLAEGATILYVVDASHPLRPSYELEMQLLNWTGQPRIALLNSTGPELYLGEWDPPLRQYFQALRRFDAVNVRFGERLRLFRLLAEAEERFSAELRAALVCLTEERSRKRRRAAEQIAALVIDLATHVERYPLALSEDESAGQEAVRQAYAAYVASRELRARSAVLDAFGFSRSPFTEGALTTREDELFSRRVYQMLGLPKWKLAGAGGVAGAATGLTLDVATAGHSLGLGALLGGALGFAAAAATVAREPEWEVPLAKRLALGPAAGYELVVGPHPSPQFRWIVLDRALLHARAVTGVSHAVQVKRDVGQTEATGQSGQRGLVSTLGPRTEALLARELAKLTGVRGRLVSRAAVKDNLVNILADVLAKLDDDAR